MQRGGGGAFEPWATGERGRRWGVMKNGLAWRLGGGQAAVADSDGDTTKTI
jgi:hypothetical protein